MIDPMVYMAVFAVHLPGHVVTWTGQPPSPTFDPPLSPAEQVVLDDLAAMASLGLQTMTLAEYQARKADVQGLRDFLALPTPTQAQAVAAEKALIRVVGTMLRLGLTP